MDSPPNDKYQNHMFLVAKLLTRFIIYRTISGPYAISWLECRQTNMFFYAKTNTLLNVQYNKVHSTTVPLCKIHVDPLMGNKSNTSTSTSTLKAACATAYKGISGALWEGNHLSEHGCPLAGATGHAY